MERAQWVVTNAVINTILNRSLSSDRKGLVDFDTVP